MSVYSISNKIIVILPKNYDNVAAIKTWLAADPSRYHGEFVLLIRGANKTVSATITPEVKQLLQLLLAELPPKKAVKITAEITHADKTELYNLAVSLR